MRPCGFVAISLMLLASGFAFAGPEEDAAPLVEAGLAELRARNYEAALEKFKEAYDVTPAPAVEVRIGLAEHGLGRWVDAELHLKSALEGAADPWIKKNRALIESTLKDLDKRLGWMIVEGAPSGAAVKLEGITRGYLPRAGPIRVEAGDLAIEVAKEAHETELKIVRVNARGTTRLNVRLRPRDVPRAYEVVPPAEPNIALAQTNTSPPPSEGTAYRRAGYGLLAGGAAVAAAGFVWLSQVDERGDLLASGKRLPFIAGCVGATAAVIGLEWLFVDYLITSGARDVATLGVKSRF